MGLDTDRDKIWVKTDHYNTDVNAALKAELPGPARWYGQESRWEFPVHWDTCVGARRVADKFGADLKIKPGLLDWAIVEKARQETIPDVQSMELVDLPHVRAGYPAIWEAMTARPFQTVGAAFAARNRSCLIADQPGLGKTIQSIAAVIESGVTGPILVVAPKAASKLTWPQELSRWVPNDVVYILGGEITRDQRAAMVKEVYGLRKRPERIWLLTSPSYLRIRARIDQYGNYEKVKGVKQIDAVSPGVIELMQVPWSAVIVDESHQTLAGATGNKKKQSYQRLGLGALDTKPDGLHIALSGTPFRGKEAYLWGQLNWLRPDMYRSYWRWVEKYFNVITDHFGTTVGNMHDPEGMYAEAKSVMIRRTKGEVAKDLPPKMYGGWPLDALAVEGKPNPIAVWLDMLPAQAKAYKAMMDDAAAELEGGTLMSNGILAELTRLKQFAGSYGKMVDEHFVPTLPSNKFDWLVEFLDERGIAKVSDVPMAERPKIVVASQFSQLINCFAEGLGALYIPTHKFTGETSDKNREAIKDDWQNNPTSSTRVLLLTTTAGGVSLTLDAASELVILDETWSASDQEQLEDRLHRLSRMHQVTIWNLRSRNTIEEGIARANLDAEMSIKSIMDGERGIAFAKELLAL